MNEAIDNLIKEEFGNSVNVHTIRQVSGGDISQSFRLLLSDQREIFLKVHQEDLFSVEAESLRVLQKFSEGCEIRIPEVLFVGNFQDIGQCLMLEWISKGTPFSDFQKRFGEQLAQLHLNATGQKFGWKWDNYIGANSQPNGLSNDWVEFYAQNRLGFQLELVQKNRLDPSGQLIRLVQKLAENLSDYFPENPTSSFIHGDLWSGNFYCDQQGRVVLVDPAGYFADSEAEFGMTTLFGGLGDEFYSAYQSVNKFRDGYQERFKIYRLYHLLNHLNLFGSGYYSDCLRLVKQLVD